MCLVRSQHEICRHVSSSPFLTSGNQPPCGIPNCHNILQTVSYANYCPTCRYNRRWDCSVERERENLEQQGEELTSSRRTQFVRALEHNRSRELARERREVWARALENQCHDYIRQIIYNDMDYESVELRNMQSYVSQYWIHVLRVEPGPWPTSHNNNTDAADEGVEGDNNGGTKSGEDNGRSKDQRVEVADNPGSIMDEIDEGFFSDTPTEENGVEVEERILQPSEPRYALSTLCDRPPDDDFTSVNSTSYYSISIGGASPITVYINDNELQEPSSSSNSNIAVTDRNVSDPTTIPRTVPPFQRDLDELLNSQFGALSNWSDEDV